MKHYFKNWIAVIDVAILSACSVHRDSMQIKPTFWQKQTTVVMTQTQDFNNFVFERRGEGLIDYAINKAITNDVESVIEQINGQPALDRFYYQMFGQFLKKKAHKVVKFDHPLPKLQAFENNTAQFAPYDFSFLKGQFPEAEYAFVVEPVRLGTQRKYYGFIPLGQPKALSVINIYLVDLKSNGIVGYFNSEQELYCTGDWDSPPYYHELVQACHNTVIQILRNSYQFLFQDLVPY